MGNAVIHFEVAGRDAAKLQDFYRNLFDWKIDTNNPMNYGIVDTDSGGSGIGGGVGQAPDGSGHVTFYVAVDDPQACLDRAVQLGGKVLTPPMEVPGGPTIAHLADPEGHMIGLVKGM